MGIPRLRIVVSRRASRAKWWVIALALGASVPATVGAFGYTQPVVLAGSAAVAALATSLAAGAQQRYLGRTNTDEEQRHNFQSGCLTDARGRSFLIREIDDLALLGVHPAIYSQERDRADRVPAYISRDLDQRLRGRLPDGGFVLLVGDSAAGKSRAAAEAMRSVIPDHVLISPLHRTAVKAAVTAMRRYRCAVLWLDDLERFLGPDGINRAVLLSVLARARPGHLVFATLRTAEYSRFVESSGDTPDRAVRERVDDARQVLALADCLRLDRRFTPGELGRAVAVMDDARIAAAVRSAERFGVAEYLAAGPDCLTLWLNAWEAGLHPRGAALVAAAIDARRAGRGALSRQLLERIHVHYLNRRGGIRLRPEPFNEAWSWAVTPRCGTTGLLIPDALSHERVQVFDYLVDAVERQPTLRSRVPSDVLLALIEEADPTELCLIGDTALESGSYHVSIRAHREVLVHRRRVLGPHHDETLKVQHRIAYALQCGNRPAEAREAWLDLIDAYTVSLGPSHELVFRSRQGLAGTLEPKEAERELFLLVKQCVQYLGKIHPYTLGCRSNLAAALVKLGRQEDATKLQQKMLDDISESMDSPDFIIPVRHQFAFTLTNLDRLDEAEPQWLALLDHYDEVGDEALALRSRQGIAWVHEKRGLTTQARCELEDLVHDYLRVVTPEHPWARSCIERLAEMKGESGQQGC